MRSMSGVVLDSVQAMFPAPVFRAPEISASACRLVSGQECFGSASAAWQVDSVSGVGVAGAADLLGLVALGEGLLAHGYAGELGQERPRPVIVSAPVTGRIQGAGQPLDGGRGVSERDGDNDSSKRDGNKGDNGTKPVNPWDFRTSSPPG
jgi:hypothetical protein